MATTPAPGLDADGEALTGVPAESAAPADAGVFTYGAAQRMAQGMTSPDLADALDMMAERLRAVPSENRPAMLREAARRLRQPSS
jgi:hypothetical protein